MRSKVCLAVLALAVALPVASVQAIAAQASQGTGKTYRWVDENGVTHYGDVVPPRYASQGRVELNSQGVAVREIPAQMTEAEAAAAQKAAAEAARRRQHDQFLLNTYTAASDIEQLRDERVALIDARLALTRGSIDSTAARLKVLEERMRSFQPYSASPTARRVPDRLAEEVVRALHEKGALEEALAARESEKRDLRERFDADLARYRELTASRQPR